MTAGAAQSVAFDIATVPNCLWWLDADDASTFTLSGVSVTQWRDKSGAARHVAPAASSPTRDHSLNGRTWVDFVPPTKKLQLASTYTLSTPFIVFTVAINDTPSTALGGIVLGQRGTTGVFSLTHGDGAANKTSVVSAGGGTMYGPANAIADTNPHTVTSHFNGASSFTRVDGAQGATENISTSNWYMATLGHSDIATGIVLDGKIGEVLVYSGTMTTTLRDRIELYLKLKWGTP